MFLCTKNKRNDTYLLMDMEVGVDVHVYDEFDVDEYASTCTFSYSVLLLENHFLACLLLIDKQCMH